MDRLMTEAAEHGCALLLVTHDEHLANAVTEHHIRLGADQEECSDLEVGRVTTRAPVS
jgi:predicted ABC-type transport system involved in lysophospholipase L1 biosynthesis ATPase subunit